MSSKKTKATPALSAEAKRPTLAGGNTINQAQKPSKAPISLPAPLAGAPSFEAMDALQAENDLLKQRLFGIEKHTSILSTRFDELVRISTQQAKVLAKQGISTAHNIPKKPEAPDLPDVG